MFNIVLFNPQIPPNTGNIGRLCVNAGSKLHIVKPIGFDISEKAVKRAGLDYWDKLDLTIWENTEEFLNSVNTERCFFATTKTNRPYFDVSFKEGDYIIFQNEKYIICDPTYINADIGMAIPQFKNVKPKIIALSKLEG